MIFSQATHKSVHFITAAIIALSIGCAGVPSTSTQTPARGQLALASGVMDFGSVSVGSSASQSITVTNQGNENVTVSQINISGQDFTMTGEMPPLSIAPGHNITTTAQFAPSSEGGASGQISFVSDASNNPVSASLKGMGIRPASPKLSATPGSLAFGNIVVGSTSTLSGTLTASQRSVTVSAASVTGNGYSLHGLNFPLTIAVNQSATFSVDFTPLTAAGLPGSISFVSNASNSPANVSLSGTGVSAPTPQLSATPSSLTFGNVTVGSTSTLSGTLTASQGSVTVSAATVTGTGYSLRGLSFPLTLAANQSATFSVDFTPLTAVALPGSISFVSNATNSPANVSLSGTGVSAPTPQLSATPSSLTFGNVTVGSTSTLSGTITASQGNVTVSAATVTGTGYWLRGLNFPLTLVANQSATFSVDFAPLTATGLPGSISFVSSASNSPANVSLSGIGTAPPPPPGGLCGQQDDGLTHLPPSYSCGSLPCATNPFPPPARGSTYADPQYGCTVRRLTDAVADGLGTAAHHNYGTVNPINASDAYVMINMENGSKEIIDVSGQVIVPAANMPATNSQQVPWDISNPTRFYYTAGTKIMRADISGLPGCASTHNCSITSTTLHDFAGTYASVQIPDQEDISDDGDHFWLVGDTKAFLYTISANTVGPALAVGTKDSGAGWHKIQIMPSNRMLMTWGPNGRGPGAGQEIYNVDTTLNWHMFDNTIHTDCGKDLSGNEVCVVARIPDNAGGINPAKACSTWTGTQDGGVDIINMSSHAAQCLVDVNWADTEISFRDGNASAGWVFITLFKSGSCNTYSCFDTTTPPRLDTTWATHWVHFAEEGLLVRIDNNNGPNKQRLFHTRSRSTEYYWAIPRGAISRDGKYVVFDSNFDISNSGLPNYTDVYITKVQ